MDGQRKKERGMSFKEGVWKDIGGVLVLIGTVPVMERSDREIDTKSERARKRERFGWAEEERKREEF